tara:strand:+ start:1227 stop:1607 length:381 start_codon:yes stop_codon:yes gene_type:complete
MGYDYDNNNIFAKILRGEIPNKTVLETDHSLAFEDISPAAPVHILVIPKGPYVSLDQFVTDASDEEIIDYSRTIGEVCKITGVQPSSGGTGFRSIANTGPDAIQEVPHFHTHIIGGRNLGRMVSQS